MNKAIALKPLKIALLTYSTKPRGSVVHTLELAEALKKLGHSPCVFALDKDGQGFYRKVSCDTVAVPASLCEGNIDHLIKQRIQEFVNFFQTHKDRYDIYHAQDCLSANALSALKAAQKISHFIRTVHHIENYKSPYLQACQEKSIYQSDRCLCVSRIWQKALQQNYSICAHRVINGVSDRFSSTPSSQEQKLAQAYNLNPNKDTLFLTVGGIEPRKNSIKLLQAFAQVHAHNPSAKLIIAGGATLFDYQDYRKDFMALATALNLKSALILPGVIPDELLPALYRLADAFVFPSIQEGWGLVVLEAIASGLPVLTANQAPFTEFLSPDSAQMVDPNNVEAIAQAMHNIVKPDIAQKLIARSAPIIQRYSWKQSAQMHLNLYQQLTT